MFKQLINMVGMSQKETAEYLAVSIQTVKAWCQGRNNPPMGAIAEMNDLYCKQLKACDEAVNTWKDSGCPDEVEIGIASDNHEARLLGWPCVGTHMMVAAMFQIEIEPARVIVVPRAAASGINDL